MSARCLGSGSGGKGKRLEAKPSYLCSLCCAAAILVVSGSTAFAGCGSTPVRRVSSSGTYRTFVVSGTCSVAFQANITIDGSLRAHGRLGVQRTHSEHGPCHEERDGQEGRALSSRSALRPRPTSSTGHHRQQAVGVVRRERHRGRQPSSRTGAAPPTGSTTSRSRTTRSAAT